MNRNFSLEELQFLSAQLKDLRENLNYDMSKLLNCLKELEALNLWDFNFLYYSSIELIRSNRHQSTELLDKLIYSLDEIISSLTSLCASSLILTPHTAEIAENAVNTKATQDTIELPPLDGIKTELPKVNDDLRRQCNASSKFRCKPSYNISASDSNSIHVGDDILSLINNTTKEKNDTLTLDQVQFSAIAPKNFIKGEYTNIEIIMYEDEFRNVVDKAISQFDTPIQEKSSGYLEAAKNTKVTIKLTSPDLQPDDQYETGIWIGRHLNFYFPVYLPENFSKSQILFTAFVYFNDVLATKLSFPVRCNSQLQQKLNLIRSDILSAFVSYASKDRARVATIIQGIKIARPDMNIYFDINNLRAGAKYNEELLREIEARDILYLCWSKNASISEWVNKEWNHALDNKGLDSIQPIAIESASECPPPEKLNKLHFNDAMLYIINNPNALNLNDSQ